jgi:hypothetical protein
LYRRQHEDFGQLANFSVCVAEDAGALVSWTIVGKTNKVLAEFYAEVVVTGNGMQLAGSRA